MREMQVNEKHVAWVSVCVVCACDKKAKRHYMCRPTTAAYPTEEENKEVWSGER